MHFLFSIFLLTVSLNFKVFAQLTQIKGVVMHQNKPVDYVNVNIVELGKGTVTDGEGYFLIENIPYGVYTLSISFIGFQTIIEAIEVHEDFTETKVYHLEKSDYLLDEILIVDEQSGLNKRTPYTISSIKADNIELKGNPSGLMGLLKEEPGINGAEMGHGIVKPFIRGLGFSRVVTIYQGNKLENHQWGADHGLGVNDLGVNQIEVIKGPASILYGSGAIGGVIIVKDNESYIKSDELYTNVGFTFNSISRGLRPNFSMGKSFQNGLFVAGDFALENHADYNDGSDRVIGNSRFNTLTNRIHIGINKEKFKNKLSYSFHNQKLGIIEDTEMIDEESRATTRQDRRMQLPFQKVSDHIISYKQTFYHKRVTSYFNISHHINSRDEIENDFSEIDLGLLQNHTFYNLRISHRISEKVNQNIGIQGSIIRNINKSVVQEILNPDARVFENGIYYLIDFDLDNYFVQAGIRYDYRFVEADASAQHLIDYGFVLAGNPENRKLSRSFQGLTGSLGISRRIKDFNTLKLNFSTGYRAPDIAELFSNGPHPGTNRFEMGNADFKREQSFQADLGWILNTTKFTVNSSVFVNFVQNYIFFAATDKLTPSELEIWEFNQANGLLYGGEISLNYSPLKGEKLLLSANVALVRGIRTDVSENLTFVPADNYRLYISSKPIDKLKLYFHSTLKYVAQHKNPGFGEFNTDSYVLWSMGANHTFDIKQHKMSLGISVLNLLNNTYFDHMSILRAFEVTSPGRNFMINLQYNF